MRKTRKRWAIGLAGLAALLGACASNHNLVVVLPEPDGHVGAVVVHAGASSAVLDKSYAAAAPTPTAANPLKPGTEDATKVNAVFGEALAALPAAPISRGFRFEYDSTTLTPESELDLRSFLDTIKTRKAVEVVITGHTDRFGTDDYNDRLSSDRANTIRSKLLPILQEYGIAADSVIAVGRGKRELIVPTGDKAEQAPNRRVEVTIR